MPPTNVAPHTAHATSHQKIILLGAPAGGDLPVLPGISQRTFQSWSFLPQTVQGEYYTRPLPSLREHQVRIDIVVFAVVRCASFLWRPNSMDAWRDRHGPVAWP